MCVTKGRSRSAGRRTSASRDPKFLRAAELFVACEPLDGVAIRSGVQSGEKGRMTLLPFEVRKNSVALFIGAYPVEKSWVLLLVVRMAKEPIRATTVLWKSWPTLATSCQTRPSAISSIATTSFPLPGERTLSIGFQRRDTQSVTAVLDRRSRSYRTTGEADPFESFHDRRSTRVGIVGFYPRVGKRIQGGNRRSVSSSVPIRSSSLDIRGSARRVVIRKLRISGGELSRFQRNESRNWVSEPEGYPNGKDH